MSDEGTRAKGIRGTRWGRALCWLWAIVRPPRSASRSTRDWPRAPHRPTEADIEQMNLYRELPAEPFRLRYVDDREEWTDELTRHEEIGRKVDYLPVWANQYPTKSWAEIRSINRDELPD